MQNLVFAHSTSEILQDIVDGDSRSFYARLSTANFGINTNSLFVAHKNNRTPGVQEAQEMGAISRTTNWQGFPDISLLLFIPE